MIHAHKPKPMQASRVQLAQLMQPEHANTQGNVHGGWIMKLVDLGTYMIMGLGYIILDLVNSFL